MVDDERAARLASVLAQLAELMADPVPPVAAPPAQSRRVLFTVAEAAEQLGIGKTTAYALVGSGELESVQIGRLRRVHADAISAYAARLVASQSKGKGLPHVA